MIEARHDNPDRTSAPDDYGYEDAYLQGKAAAWADLDPHDGEANNTFEGRLGEAWADGYQSVIKFRTLTLDEPPL